MTTPTIKAIETEYKGYRFRSRLEARWAVFFDANGIEWQYEPEGFVLDLGNWYANPPAGVSLSGSQAYLPDFYLPQVKMFAEVKPQWPSPNELALCNSLSENSKKTVLILDGPPDHKLYFGINGSEFEHGGWDIEGTWFDLNEGHHYWKYENRFWSLWDEHITDWDKEPERPEPDSWSKEDSVRYGDAVNAARSARFEHGEKGAQRRVIPTSSVMPISKPEIPSCEKELIGMMAIRGGAACHVAKYIESSDLESKLARDVFDCAVSGRNPADEYGSLPLFISAVQEAELAAKHAKSELAYLGDILSIIRSKKRDKAMSGISAKLRLAASDEEKIGILREMQNLSDSTRQESEAFDKHFRRGPRQ